MRPVAYFVRHATTDLNDSNIFRGDLDVPLNDRGKKEAQQLVQFFEIRTLARFIRVIENESERQLRRWQ